MTHGEAYRVIQLSLALICMSTAPAAGRCLFPGLSWRAVLCGGARPELSLLRYWWLRPTHSSPLPAASLYSDFFSFPASPFSFPASHLPLQPFLSSHRFTDNSNFQKLEVMRTFPRLFQLLINTNISAGIQGGMLLWAECERLLPILTWSIHPSRRK